MSAALLAALLALGPPASVRACLRQRVERIAADAQAAAAATGVPVALLLAVGWAETHLGCDHGEGGGWGAPVSRHRRHVAGRPLHAALALAWGHRRCRTWDGALHHFRTGLCRPTRAAERRIGYRASRCTALARRLEGALR